MKYSFKELVDVPKLQDLTDEMYAAFSIPCSIIATDGEILTGVGWQKICTDFHRKHPQAEKECVESDVKIRRKLDRGDPFVIYKCPRGLVDASSPVIIAGEHLANVFSGQIFLEAPDESTERFFREQARRFGFDEARYMEAFREIPVFDEDKFRAALFFLAKMAGIIADAGLARLEVLDAADALRESERRLQSILDYSPARIFLKDLEGRYILVNRQCEISLGLANDDIVGKTVYDLVPEHFADRFAANDRKVLETGAVLEVEEVIPGKNGDCTLLTVLFPLLDADGKPYAIGGVSTDITLRKKAQKERMESRERLARKRRMEALGTLAGGIAHEFNNLLGVVLGNVELAMEDFPKDHPAAKYLDDAKTASLHGAGVVKQILRFMRKVPGEKHPVMIAPVVRETLKLMRVAIPKNIEIKTDIRCGAETVLATPGDLGQVVVNLCSNASHAIGESGGVISVDLDSAYLSDPVAMRHENLRPGRYVKLVVKDNGAGIDPEIMDRIFEPYFTTKEIDQGLGMGLSVVYGIVKDCEGSIKVESRLGQGTSVEVLLHGFPAENETAL